MYEEKCGRRCTVDLKTQEPTAKKARQDEVPRRASDIKMAGIEYKKNMQNMDVVMLVFLPCLQRMKYYVARQLALSLHLFTSARDKNSTVLPGQTFLRRCELDADGKGKHIECLGFLHRYLQVCLHSVRGIRYI